PPRAPLARPTFRCFPTFLPFGPDAPRTAAVPSRPGTSRLHRFTPASPGPVSPAGARAAQRLPRRRIPGQPLEALLHLWLGCASEMTDEFERYEQTARAYDVTRVPVGIEVLLGCLAAGDTALEEQTILDAGCGTGSYLVALAGRVRRICGIDINAKML